MFEQLYKFKTSAVHTINLLKSSPFKIFLDDLMQYFLNQGYIIKKLRPRFAVVCCLSQWLLKNKIKLDELNEKEINNFMNYRSKQTNLYKRGELITLNALFKILRLKKVIPDSIKKFKKPISKTKFDKIIEEYNQYLINECGLSNATISKYIYYTNYFFKNYPDKNLQSFLLKKISIEKINDFILSFVDKGKLSIVKSLSDTLRSFFRFLFLTGKINLDYSLSIQRMRDSKYNNLPYFLTKKELEQLLQTCKGKSAVKRRNYAILLLLSKLGLRAIEIIKLTLDDIDWERGEIIVNGKGNKKCRLPLINEIGEAIVSYLKNGRPSSLSRYLFLSSKPPIKPFKNHVAISSIVKRALKKTNLNPVKMGAHLLRHTFATECLRKGISLTEIGQILRHEHIDTTAIYAKIDFDRLKSIVKKWPQ